MSAPNVKQNKDNPDNDTHEEGSRRDFMQLVAAFFGAIGGAFAIWPFIDSLNPAKDTLALSTVEVDVANIPKGQSKTIMWRGKPVFIKHRTEEEIAEAREVNVKSLPDMQTDEERVQKPEWLITVGICTHLGCVPAGQKTGDAVGDYGGWFCPCHGSHYDTSGRIRKGPAPKNLEVPPYEFMTDTLVKIG